MKIKILYFFCLFIACFFFCFKSLADEKDQENSNLSKTFNDSNIEANEDKTLDSSILPAKKEKPLLKYIEISRLNMKLGVKNVFSEFTDSEFTEKIWRFPVVLEFQAPIFLASGNLRWLAEAGGGWMKYVAESCDNSRMRRRLPSEPFMPRPSEPKPPFDSDFFQRSYERQLERYEAELKEYEAELKEYEEKGCQFTEWNTTYSFPYVTFQTGLQYNFQPVTLSLLGGTIVGFSGPQTMGFTGSLLLGWNISDVFYLNLGVEYLHYDQDYIGLSLSMGFTLKKWWEKLYFQ